MNDNERLNLQKMINENNVVDYTNDIREKKHSTKIKEDVQRLLRLKETYSNLDLEQLDEMCVYQCNFLFTNYTDIYNRIKKDELNLTILDELLAVLAKIENSALDQHAGAYEVGKILKAMYIDSALIKADKIDKKTGKKIEGGQKEVVPAKNISWKEYKQKQ
jgi:hypothetical protein